MFEEFISCLQKFHTGEIINSNRNSSSFANMIEIPVALSLMGKQMAENISLSILPLVWDIYFAVSFGPFEGFAFLI